MPLNLKEFEPIQDTRMVQRYLQSLVSLREDIECYLKESDLRFNAFASGFDPSMMRLEISIDTSSTAAEKIRTEFNNSMDRNIVLNFRIQDTPFLINSALTIAQPQSLSVQALLPLYKLQRRQALRMKLQEEFPCTVLLPTPWEDLPMRPHDISTSGFSLLVNEKIAAHFTLGDTLQAFSLQFQGLKDSVQAKVSHIVHLPNDRLDRWKIGFNFQGMSTRLEREIAKSAYEFNRRIWARRI